MTDWTDGMRRFWEDLMGNARWDGDCPMCVGGGRVTATEEDATGLHWTNVPCPWCDGRGLVLYQVERRPA